MIVKLMFASLVTVAWVLFPGTARGIEPAGTGFGYAVVTEKDVVRMRFNHYFDEKKAHHDAEFSWVFAEDGTFQAKAGKGPIAAELRKRLLGELLDAQVIAGRWRIVAGKNGGTTIVFRELTADGKERQVKEASYAIYRTAPTVIRIGEPQYVFGL